MARLQVHLVRVGTRNVAKLAAVRSAIGEYASDCEVLGADVLSEVAEQPVGLAEIVAGARNRARAALRAGPCELAVGIEDGLVELADVGTAALNIGAAVVTDGNRDEVGLSAAFSYPSGCLETALAERVPIGELFDAQWNAYSGSHDAPPSGRGIGNIGKLSLGVLTRAEYGRHAVLCALLPFLHPGLYPAPSVHPVPERAPGPVDD